MNKRQIELMIKELKGIIDMHVPATSEDKEIAFKALEEIESFIA